MDQQLGLHIHVHVSRRIVHTLQLLLLGVMVSSLMIANKQSSVSASLLSSRVVGINDSGAAAVTEHAYTFDINTSTLVGSISFEYCENSPLDTVACSPPSGMDLSTATLSAESGETGFAIAGTTTANKLVIGRVPVVASAGTVSYQFDSVTNPSLIGQTYYVRLGTFASSDGSGPKIEDGAVAFAITQPLMVNAYVPPFLVLCVGVTVAIDCSSTAGDVIDLGILSPATTSVATAQFSTATNGTTGYNAFLMGTTMTAGNNVIPALGSQTGSSPGTSQFGINARANTSPGVGNDPDGIGSASVSTLYDDVNAFRYVSGDLITSSPLPTEYNRFTIAYLVNVAPDQAPGIYATTTTILATANF